MSEPTPGTAAPLAALVEAANSTTTALDDALVQSKAVQHQLDVSHARFRGRIQGFLVGYLLMGTIWLLVWWFA